MEAAIKEAYYCIFFEPPPNPNWISYKYASFPAGCGLGCPRRRALPRPLLHGRQTPPAATELLGATAAGGTPVRAAAALQHLGYVVPRRSENSN